MADRNYTAERWSDDRPFVPGRVELCKSCNTAMHATQIVRGLCKRCRPPSCLPLGKWYTTPLIQ